MKPNKPITKKQLERIAKLNKRILNLFPEGDSMRETYKTMQDHLENRIETYEQFKINPYSAVTNQFKYNTDVSLELGEYSNID